MRVTTISVTRIIKVNLGNFQNTDIAITMTGDVIEGEDALTVTANLCDRVRSVVATELTDLAEKSPANVPRPEYFGL